MCIMTSQHTISGNLFVFHAFDVGDEIDLEAVKRKQLLVPTQQPLAPYFKNYHIPLGISFPANHTTVCERAALHNFGVIALRYRIPFSNTTFEELRTRVLDLEELLIEQAITDAGILFHTIHHEIKQARFFHIRNSYMLVQVDHLAGSTDINSLKQEYGNLIAPLLRFEKEILSEHQKDEILESAFSYYHKDLIIIDVHAAFICDDEYEEVLDLFEFANVQHLELQYFDRVLDKQLNIVYEQEKKTPPLSAYLPFIGVIVSDPVGDLGKLKVDISVITDRLENSIKLTGEAYFSKLYGLLSEKLDLNNWKESISRKLAIIEDIGSIYQHKLEVIREDLLTCSIIVLIMLELLMAAYHGSQ